MALKRFTIDGYGQIELNQCAFRRDGRIEAQCALYDKEFAKNQAEYVGGKIYAENGMILAVDISIELLDSLALKQRVSRSLLTILLNIYMMKDIRA